MQPASVPAFRRACNCGALTEALLPYLEVSTVDLAPGPKDVVGALLAWHRITAAMLWPLEKEKRDRAVRVMFFRWKQDQLKTLDGATVIPTMTVNHLRQLTQGAVDSR